MIKRKYMNGKGWDFLGQYECTLQRVEGKYTGYVSYIKVGSVKRKIMADYNGADTVLINAGYHWVMFLPDHQNWAVGAIYNDGKQIVDWYFDITKQNSVDEEGNPFYDDIYLDVVVTPDFNILVLDEDELLEALESKEITQDDYDMAHRTADRIINEIVPDREFMVGFLRGRMW